MSISTHTVALGGATFAMAMLTAKLANRVFMQGDERRRQRKITKDRESRQSKDKEFRVRVFKCLRRLGGNVGNLKQEDEITREDVEIFL